jgi:uncharacterized protein (DUF342 family)
MITDLLKEKQVRFGLSSQDMTAAEEALESGKPINGAVLARGTPAQKGEDARLDILVDIERLVDEYDESKVDVRDRGRLPLVNPGDPIAQLHPATKGLAGRDVTGRPILPPKGRILRLRAGHGAKLVQDGNLAVADAQGMVVQSEPDLFEVHEIFEVNGDVDFASGHIVFPGLVKVRGAILPDFKVRCGNLEVETMEPGSMVEVTGDLKVHGGIMGAVAKVGGSVEARYIRQSRIVCGGDVFVNNELVGSQIQSAGRITITSGTGRIVNSRVAAVKGMVTGDIVSSGKGNTVLRLGVSDSFAARVGAIKHAIEKLKRQERQFNEGLVGEIAELESTEKELREILADLNKKDLDEATRENLMAQVQMIKPIRATLKEGVEEGNKHLEEVIIEKQTLSDKLLEMEALIPTGAVWLDVRGTADSSTEIVGPHASLVLNHSQAAFSCRETETKDQDSDKTKIVIKLGPLRTKIK